MVKKEKKERKKKKKGKEERKRRKEKKKGKEERIMLCSTFNAGFFACCSHKLSLIATYYKEHGRLPERVDSSKSFLYYSNDSSKDTTYDFFDRRMEIHHPGLPPISSDDSQDSHESSRELNDLNDTFFDPNTQFSSYATMNFSLLTPVVTKYFTPSTKVLAVVRRLETLYGLNPVVYENACAIYYRGNDKIVETTIPSYTTVLEKVRKVSSFSSSPLRYVLQTDEKECLDFFKLHLSPTISFEKQIAPISKDSTFEFATRVSPKDNHDMILYLFAILYIFSKCKYVVCGYTNGSVWLTLYRGHAQNVFQV